MKTLISQFPFFLHYSRKDSWKLGSSVWALVSSLSPDPWCTKILKQDLINQLFPLHAYIKTWAFFSPSWIYCFELFPHLIATMRNNEKINNKTMLLRFPWQVWKADLTVDVQQRWTIEPRGVTGWSLGTSYSHLPADDLQGSLMVTVKY